MRRSVVFWMLAGMVASASAEDGAALFKSKCTACHNETKVMAGVRKIPEAERPARLEQRLSAHFAPDPAQRKAIVDHLVKLAGQ